MFKPLRNLVLVDSPEEQQVSAGGIHIAGVKEHPHRTGTVISVGPGAYIDNKFVPTVVKPGDKVMFILSTSEKIKVDGKEYLIVAESNLYGKLEG